MRLFSQDYNFWYRQLASVNYRLPEYIDIVTHDSLGDQYSHSEKLRIIFSLR